MSEGAIAWMLVATALVLLMTPALGFSMGGSFAPRTFSTR